AKPTDALDFKLNQLLAKETSTGVDAGLRMVDAVLGIMALAPSVPGQQFAIKQELILTRLSHRLSLRSDVVRKRLAELQVEKRREALREAERAKTMPMASAAQVTTPPKNAKPNGAPSEQTVLEKQLLQLLLADPALVRSSQEVISMDRIEHSGIRRVIQELYTLQDAGQLPDMDSLRVRLIDRPDLARAALDNQHIGRNIADRGAYFDKVVAGFARLAVERERLSVKQQLNASGNTNSLDALRQYQELSRRKPPEQPGRAS
ncbi:MAG: hypothetical protein ACRCZF_28050, partial [Gemmataceae bacterium]